MSGRTHDAHSSSQSTQVEIYELQNGFNESLSKHKSQNQNGTNVTTKLDVDDDITKYGLGSCRPNVLQCCSNLLPFSFVYGFSVLVTQALGVYISSQITALERQFDLTSTEGGIIMSCNDIGFLVTVLFISYYGPRGHIPRIIAAGTFLYGISGVLSSLPHFFEGHTDTNKKAANKSASTVLCGMDNINITSGCDEHKDHFHNAGTKWIVIYFGICLIIQGFGKTPRSSLGTLYLDSSKDKTKTGLYLAITTTMGLFGPVLAVTLGGVFGKIPVDLKPTSIQPEDPRWVGAWWIGFLMFGVLGILSSIPVFFFPRKMKSFISEDDRKQMDDDQTSNKKTLCENIKGFPKAMIRIFKKPIYCLNVVGIACILFAIIGPKAFGPKYLENVFNLPSWKANLIQGGEGLITSVVGTFSGGLITSKLKLTKVGMIRMIFVLTVITGLLESLHFIFGCDNPDIKGLNNRNYSVENCDCGSASFFSVCGADGNTYFSPCHAGCSNVTNNEYGGCMLGVGSATPGICDSECWYLIPYVVIAIIKSLAGTLRVIPIYTVILRSVEEQDRSMAMGIISFLLSLIVFLPAPIVFGKIFDSTCNIWKSTCNTQGACQLYDIEMLKYRTVGVAVGLQAVASFVYLVALVISYKTADDNGENDVKIKLKAQK